jgi:hypothetical protein
MAEIARPPQEGSEIRILERHPDDIHSLAAGLSEALREQSDGFGAYAPSPTNDDDLIASVLCDPFRDDPRHC